MAHLRRPILLFGADGRLGSAVGLAAARRGIAVTAVPWTQADAALILNDNADVVFAGGLIDPGALPAALMVANCEFPSRLIERMASAPARRFLTIGSALETFARLSDGNPYLASKAALWARIQILAARRQGRLAHLRLHTLYGGPPASHSFLGQIFASIRAKRPFPMSAGNQLREYCHVGDVADSILTLLGRKWSEPVDIELSTGEPFMLRELASQVFAAFGRADLLRIGALATPTGENLDMRFPRSPDWLLGHPRDPVQGIIDWFRELLNWQRSG